MSDFEEPPAKAIDLQRYVMLLLRTLPFILICTVLVGIVAFIYAKSLPSFYESRATLLVENTQTDVVNLGNRPAEVIQSGETLNTVVDMLRSRTLIESVALQKRFANDPRFAPPKGGDAEWTPTELGGKLSYSTDVSLRPETRLIDITVQDEDPELARELAAAIYDGFIQSVVRQRSDTAMLANKYLVEEEARLREQLEKSERALQEYREKNEAVFFDDRQGVMQQQLQQISSDAAAARNERLRIESDLQLLDTIGPGDSERAIQVVSVAELPTVMEAKKAFQEAEANFNVLKQRYMSKHPRYGEALSRTNELERALNKVVLDSQTVILPQRLELARGRERRLDELVAKQQQNALENQRVAIPYNVISRQAESDRVLYEAIVARLKASSLAPASVNIPYRLVEAPIAAEIPSKPGRKKIVLAGLMAGFILSVGFVLGRDFLDRSVRDANDLKEIPGLRTLAMVPNPTGMPVPLSTNALGSEEYRVLRSVVALPEADGSRSILLAGPTASRSVAAIALNLAAAFERQGSHTLLVEMDLRNPRLAELCGIGTLVGEGFSGALVGNASSAQPVPHPTQPLLWVLAAGPASGAALELAGGPRISELLAEWRVQFHRIVVLAPAFLEVSDSRAAAAACDTVCLVVEEGRTARAAVEQARQIAIAAGAPSVAAVLVAGKVGKSWLPLHGKASV